MKNVFIVGICGVPNKYGGFEALAENLIRYNESGSKIRYTVFCEKKLYENDDLEEEVRCNRIFLPLRANGVSSILYDVLAMIICIYRRPDVVLVLGSSGAFFIPILRYLSFGKSKIVFNLDGKEWAREKWGKLARIYLMFCEKIGAIFSHHIIADNKVIYDYVKMNYSTPVSEIAYGGDNAVRVIGADHIGHENSDYFLSICRIEPENNVHVILEGFARSTKKLIFIGNWDNSAYSKKLFVKYQKHENILLLMPIYDHSLLFHYRLNCVCYVHGHSAGGTNPSLVEMLHFNSPILAFECNYNRETLSGLGKYFSSPEDLLVLSESPYFGWENETALNVNNKQQKSLADKKYTWSAISSRYNLTFEDS